MTQPIIESHDHTMHHNGITEQHIHEATCVYDMDLEYTEMIMANVMQRNRDSVNEYRRSLILGGMSNDTDWGELNKLCRIYKDANEEDPYYNDEYYDISYYSGSASKASYGVNHEMQLRYSEGV